MKANVVPKEVYCIATLTETVPYIIANAQYITLVI